MGLFDYFKRRRESESAIPPAQPSPPSPSPAREPIGEPIGQVHPQAGAQAFDLQSLISGSGDLAGLGSVLQGLSGANPDIQVTRTEQTIDMTGTGLREQIMEAMRQAGIDPDSAQGSQIDASAVPGLQAQILQALEAHGVDLDQLGGAQADISIEPGEGEPDAR